MEFTKPLVREKIVLNVMSILSRKVTRQQIAQVKKKKNQNLSDATEAGSLLCLSSFTLKKLVTIRTSND